MASWRKDWFIVGSLAGGFASILKTIVDLGSTKAGIAKLHHVDIAGGFILGIRGGPKPRKPLEKGLGAVADVLLGSLFGSGLALLIAKTPKGLEKTKGTIFGTSLWGTTLALGTLLQINGLSKPDPRSMSSMLFTSTLFGTLTGALIKRIAKFDQAEPFQPTIVSLKDNTSENIAKVKHVQ